MNCRPFPVLLIAIAALLALPAGASAATKTFDGEGGPIWSTPASWDNDTVPNPGDDIVIPAGQSALITADFTANTVTVDGTLTFSALTTLTVSNAVTADPDIVVGAAGILSVGNANTSLIASTNDTVVRVQNAGVFRSTGSTVVATGTTSLVLTGAGTTRLSGTINSFPATLASIDVESGALAFMNTGHVIPGDPATVINVANGAQIRYDGDDNFILAVPVVLESGADLSVATTLDNKGLRLDNGVDFGGDNGVSISGSPGAFLEIGAGANANTLAGDVAASGAGTIRLVEASTLDLVDNAFSIGTGTMLLVDPFTNGAKIDADASSLLDGDGTLTWTTSNPFATNSVVTTGADLLVDTSTTTNFDGSTFTVNGVWDADGGQLHSASQLTVNGTFRNTSTVSAPLIDSAFQLNGTMELGDDADVQFDGATDFDNYTTAAGGTLTGGTWKLGASSRVILGAFAGVAVFDGSDVTLGPGGIFAGAGFADQLPGHAISITGGGALRFDGGTTGFTSRSMTAGTSFTVTDGTLSVGGEDGMELNAFGAINVGVDGHLEVAFDTSISSSSITSAGRIAGEGAISGGAFAINGGTVEPGGNAIGSLTFNAPVQFNDGVLDIQISGPDFGDADFLSMQGPTVRTFDSDFEIAIDSTGFVAPAYDFTREIVRASGGATLTGDAPALTGSLTAPRQYELSMDADSVDVSVTENEVPVGPTTSTVAPVITTPTNDNTVTVTFAGAGDGSGSGLSHYLVLFDQNADQDNSDVVAQRTVGLPATFTSDPLADGTWHVHLAAVDNEGNVSTTTDIGPFVIDTTPPAVPSITGGPAAGSTTTSTSATFTFTTPAGATSMECRLSTGIFAACDTLTSHALTGLTTLTRTFEVRALDAVGNASAAATRTWTIVEGVAPTAPTSLITSHTAGASSNDNTITVGVTGATDNVAIGGYAVSVTAGATDDPGTILTHALAGDGNIDLPAVADGRWYVHVRTVDAAGNVSAATTHAGPFIIDTAAPAAPTFGDVPSARSTATSATVSFSGETGATFTCSLDLAPFAACTSPVALTGLAIGDHSFRVTAVDAAGNTSAPATANWTVTRPAVAPVKPAPTKIVFSGRAPKLAAVGTTGKLAVKLPVTEAGVVVKFELRANRAQARLLGLVVPRGKTYVVLGTGRTTTRAAGTPTVTITLTRAAKAAFARIGSPRSTVRSATVTLVATLTKGGLTSTVTKPLTIRK